MKKIILLLSVIMFLGCSSDDDNSANSSIQINPPNWIQGEWLQEGTDNGWRFTSNDVIALTAGLELSLREEIEAIINSGQNASATDESTENTYKLTRNFPAGQTIIHSFTKVSDTELRWEAVPLAVFIKQ